MTYLTKADSDRLEVAHTSTSRDFMPGATGELGSDGEYNWDGAAGTRFWMDPKQDMIGVFMVQSRQHRTQLASRLKTLVYQALQG